jgi:hypothetical protein
LTRPIITDSRNGVGTKDTLKSNYSIVYTGSSAPKPLDGERGMRPPIRVLPKSKSQKLTGVLRLDYSRIYTVEHDVKVYEYGTIAYDQMTKFRQNFDLVFNSEEKDDDSEEDDEDEDEDEEEDDNEEDEGGGYGSYSGAKHKYKGRRR